jgi:hypothetical protein
MAHSLDVKREDDYRESRVYEISESTETADGAAAEPASDVR